MSRYNHPHRFTKTTLLGHFLGGLVCAAILLFLCPHEASMKLEYHIGEPWDSEALIAKDSFDIYKSEEELRADLDSLRKLYEPFYDVREDVTATVMQTFRRELDSLARKTRQTALAQYLESELDKRYRAGILSNKDLNQLKHNGVNIIHKYRRPVDAPCSLEQLHSVKSTLEGLAKDIPGGQEMLRKTHLPLYLQPNLVYNQPLSAKQQAEINRFATKFTGRVMIGEEIVHKGQIVTQDICNRLRSYELHEKERGRSNRETLSQIGGHSIYILLIILSLYVFLRQFRNDYLYSQKHLLLICLLFLLFPAACYALVSHNFLNIYVVPYCMIPIFLRIFMDSRTAFITHLACIMLCALATNRPFDFISIQVLAGLTAIYSLKQLQQRSELFRSVLLVTTISLFVALCMDLIHMNFFNNADIDWSTYVYICVNGILLFISYLLLFPIEKAFGFTSMVTLVELSNINHPLLRRLSEEAPGTFQHSMQVANLAAAVANALGAKSQLVRTGALYHDIGKLENPGYFTENQGGINPHDGLTPIESAQIIIQHVRNGEQLAHRHNLPQDIVDLITTHHGRSKAKYFYITYCNENPDVKVNSELFTYPGPNPTTIEQAILMMADSVEAASRSLKEYTPESIGTLVDHIIDAQLQEGYFNQCDITFAEVGHAKHVFKEKLKSIYHARISYPELKPEAVETQQKEG